ncbi:MAG: UvrD-helicase domain-containing protein [Planctomycetes bacterium]|nr:UvrD-helicase domain-containing protein [Planctomycetota bacterium]
MSIGTLPHTLIRASAGTGKTFALSNRYLSLLCGGAKIDEVLATTFTRKAAAQILDRVLFRLAEAALDDARCAALAAQLEVAALDRPRALALLAELLSHLDRLQVMTLDSFFAQVASRFALELGLPAGWAIADELQDGVVRHEAIEAMLAAGGEGTIVRLLQLMTQGEARRSVTELIESTVTQLYSLFCQSGDPAWRKLPHPTPLGDERLADLIEQLRATPLPEDKRFAKAREKELELALASDWDSLAAGGLIGKVLSGENAYYKKPIPADAIAIYVKLIEHIRAVQLLRLARQTEATADMLKLFDQEYRQLKRRRRLARFDDVTSAVANDNALDSAGGLAWRLEADVRHLLLDEFQDTSLTQWQAIRPLARRACQSGPAAGSLFAVGDVKQAIYGWRGGIAEIFDTLTQELPALKQSDLNQSYRSAPQIMETVNRAFSPAMHQNHGNLEDLEAPVAAWCGNMPEQTTAKNELAGYAVLLAGPEPTKPTGVESTDDGEDANLATLRFAAQKIADLRTHLAGRTIGVLVRTNQTVARMIHELRKLHVDASEEGGNPLTDSAAVGVVLSLLRLADHPGDSVSAYHVAHSPLGPVVGLSDDRDMVAVCRLAREVRRDLLSDGYGTVIGRLGQSLAASCDPREMHRLRQLIELANDYDRDATLRADAFVKVVEETRRQQAVSASVRVMTVHQAKGLEFDAVVLPNLDFKMLGQPRPYVAGRARAGEPVDRVCLYRSKAIQSLLPPEFQELFTKNTQLAVDEALSLLYVMLTRARQGLYMIVKPDKADKISLHKTFAGLLRASLAPGQIATPGSTLYQCGEEKWWEESIPHAPREESITRSVMDTMGTVGVQALACVSEISQKAVLQPVTIQFAPSTGPARRAAESDSPSRLEGGPQRTAESLLRTEGAAARCRGQLIHAWFEQVQWLDEVAHNERLSDDTLTRIARRLAVEGGRDGWPEIEAELKSHLARFRNMLAKTEIKAALSRSAYQAPNVSGMALATGALFHERCQLPSDVTAELKQGDLDLSLRRESRIAARRDGRLIGGQADRIVIMSRHGRRLAAEVIDLKTDQLDANDPAAIAAKVDFYRPQLAAYCDAVAQMYRLDPKCVCARLLFVEPGVVAEV